MAQVACPRCGSVIDEDDHFCVHCGLPQLRLGEGVVSTPEPANQGRPSEISAPNPGKTDWRYALRCAAVAAAIGALLQLGAEHFKIAEALRPIWVLCASIAVVAAYQRGRPRHTVDARLGGRVGATTGVLMSALMVAVTATYEFVLRYKYGSHMMDDALNMVLAQARAQHASSPEVEQMLALPEFRVGLVMMMAAMGCAFVIAITTVTGFVAGAAFSPRRQPRA